MAKMLNALLENHGLPLKEVRLIRHADRRSDEGRSPCELWKEDRAAFEFYQATQTPKNRKKLDRAYWAVFVSTPEKETLFAGLWFATCLGLNKEARRWANADGRVDAIGTVDVYDLVADPRLKEFVGRMTIDWGSSFVSWIQYAHSRDKPILQI